MRKIPASPAALLTIMSPWMLAGCIGIGSGDRSVSDRGAAATPQTDSPASTAVGAAAPAATTPTPAPLTYGPDDAPLIGGRIWHGHGIVLDVGRPTLAAQERDEFRRFARSMAICSADEAIDFLAGRMAMDDWMFAIARRSTKEQSIRWLKGKAPTDPSTETSSVLWIIGIYAVHDFTEGQYHGWMFPSTEAREGHSVGFRDAVFAFAEDGSPVWADRARHVVRTTSGPHEPFTDAEYIAALRPIGDLPTVPSQMEQFPDLDGLCDLPRE